MGLRANRVLLCLALLHPHVVNRMYYHFDIFLLS